MFDPNAYENRPIEPNLYNATQEAIAPNYPLGLDTADIQPTQLLGSEDVNQQLQDTLETQFLEDEDSVTPSSEAEMGKNLWKKIAQGISSPYQHRRHRNIRERLKRFLKEDPTNSQDNDELTGMLANFSTQSVGPDLTITNLSAPNTVSPGDFIRLDYSITNQGNGDVNTWSQTKFYLSADTTLDATDTYLTSDYNYAWNLSAGASHADYVYLSLNQNLEAGNYYILGQADANHEISESNESNNITYQQITLGGTPEPDLIISNLSGDNVALMLEANPSLTEPEIRQIVTGTAQNTQYS